MGALPKRKISKSRQGGRRSHIRLRSVRLAECPECHKPRPFYHVCPSCGYYQGKKVVEVKETAPQRK